MPNLEDDVDELMKEESGQARAVKSLIEVKDKKPSDFGSEIELKTDLSERDVNLHTAVDMLDNFLNIKKFKKSSSILGDLVQLKERKLLSKDRKSRNEIVNVARNPDMSSLNFSNEDGFVKRFFSSRKKMP